MTRGQLTLSNRSLKQRSITLAQRITLSAVWVTLRACFPITCPAERSEITTDFDLLSINRESSI